MKKCKLTKKYSVLFLLLCTLSIPAISSIPAITVSAADIQPMSDRIEWIYRIIDGKYYKRLYNYTTASWIGDWIPVNS